MAKKTQKKLQLEDFLIPALSDQPTKLFFTLDGEPTEEYLLVLCSSHAEVKRPLVQYGISLNKLKASCTTIEDEVDKVMEYSDGEKEINQSLSADLVSGWSLGEFSADLLDKLLTGNESLVNGIIAQSFTVADYVKKK